MEEENTEQEEAQKNSQENADSENGEEKEDSEEELTSEQIEDLKKKADVSSQNFERAKKAEEELKTLKSQSKEESKVQNLSPKDYIALTEKGITSQDFDEVMDYATYKDMSVSDALEDSTLNTILQQRQEERKTADATHTKGGARGQSKNDGESLLQRFEGTGELPESDEEQKKMFQAEIDRKRRK